MNTYTDKTNYDFNFSYIADLIRVASYRATGEALADEMIAMIMSYKTHRSPIALTLEKYNYNITTNHSLMDSFKFVFNNMDNWLDYMTPNYRVGEKHNSVGTCVIGEVSYSNEGEVYYFALNYMSRVGDIIGFTNLESVLSNKTLYLGNFYKGGYEVGKYESQNNIESINILIKAIKKMGYIKPFGDKVYEYGEITNEMCMSVLQFWLVSSIISKSKLIVDSDTFIESVMELADSFKYTFMKIENHKKTFAIDTTLQKIKKCIFTNGVYKYAKLSNKLLKVENREGWQDTRNSLPYYGWTKSINDKFANKNFLNTECRYGTRKFLDKQDRPYGSLILSDRKNDLNKDKMITIIKRFNENNNDMLKFSKSWTTKRLYQLWNTGGTSEEARLNKVIFNRVLKVVNKRKITEANVKKFNKFKNITILKFKENDEIGVYTKFNKKYCSYPYGGRVIDLRNRIVEDNYY